MTQVATPVPKTLGALIDIMRSAVDSDGDQQEHASALAKLSSQEVFRLAGEQNVLWPIIHLGMASNSAGQTHPFEEALHKDIEAKAASLAHQLEETVTTICKVCEPILLKGACFIAEDDFRSQPWRYMVDFDMLVPADKLEAAVQTMTDSGYTPIKDIYEPAIENHFPFLAKPDRPAGIELHTRCIRWAGADLLEVSAIRKRAVNMKGPTGSFLLPSANDRLVHLIAHAQIGSHYYRRRLFKLRDAVDFLMLVAREDADLEDVGSTFVNAGHQHEFLSFLRMTEFIWQRQFLAETAYSSRHDRWVRTTLSNISDPRHALPYLMLDLFFESLEFAARPSRWPALLALLRHRQVWGRYLADLKKHVQVF